MRVVCISDTHNFHDKLLLPPGDLLIHAGDATMGGSEAEAKAFLNWFAKQHYHDKVFIPGNHDFFFQTLTEDGAIQLERELVEQEGNFGYMRILNAPHSTTWVDNFSITGFPWTLPYGPWAYMAPEEELERKLENIGRCDILVSHGPPSLMQDKTKDGRHAGSQALLEWLHEHRPSLLVCGHIHEARGMWQVGEPPDVTVVNAAVCNYPVYSDLRPPIVLDIEKKTEVRLVV